MTVWIMGHVLSGWDGTNPLMNPTDLCELLLAALCIKSAIETGSSI